MSKSRDLSDRRFWIAKEEEIRNADVTDVYFLNTLETLAHKRLDPKVVFEVYARSLPYPEDWGVVSGIYEAAKLLEGKPLNADAMEEGEIFLTAPRSVVYEPVMQIEGSYRAFAAFENPILGFICSSTSVSTKAARVRLAAGDKAIFSFGTRRAHPALAPTVERAAYIGGLDSVSNVLGSRLMGKKPVGTMPHALIQCFGDQVEAWKAFDEAASPDVPRIALIDTFHDEKSEAIAAWRALGSKLNGVRIDTPGSRRGDLKKIVEEVKWELAIRGGGSVKIIVSGGMDEEAILELAPIVDGFGVGTSVSSPPPVDFSAKIVQIRVGGKDIYRAKRGDIGGRKMVYRDAKRFEDIVTLATEKRPKGVQPLLTPLIRNGRIVRKFKNLDEIRGSVIEKLKLLRTVSPSVRTSVWARG